MGCLKKIRTTKVIIPVQFSRAMCHKVRAMQIGHLQWARPPVQILIGHWSLLFLDICAFCLDQEILS